MHDLRDQNIAMKKICDELGYTLAGVKMMPRLY